MATWTRDEIEREFEQYQQRGRDAVETGDWGPWAAQFTEDAHYIEHHYGEFHGRAAIAEWISATMADVPEMFFPVEWYVIDDDRGWVVFLAWNRMPDPDGNGPYQAGSWSLLKYAGDGQWSYEEDMYNPNEFAEMLQRWGQAKAGGS